jgi:hypothetical protein
MMNGDEPQRGNSGGIGNRGNPQQRFSDNRGNYSPSASYNFNTRNAGGSYNSPQQNMRKRVNKFQQRPNPNSSDRIAKQNDIIIRLLKEIRDRLPPPPESAEPLPPESAATTESFHYGNEHSEETISQDDSPEVDDHPEPGDQEEYPADEPEQPPIDRLANDDQPA